MLLSYTLQLFGWRKFSLSRSSLLTVGTMWRHVVQLITNSRRKVVMVGWLALPDPVRGMRARCNARCNSNNMPEDPRRWCHFHITNGVCAPLSPRRPPLMGFQQWPLTTHWVGGFTILSRWSTGAKLSLFSNVIAFHDCEKHLVICCVRN